MKTCIIEGCEKERFSSKHCRHHHHKSTYVPRARKVVLCNKCENKHFAKGLCRSCYYKSKRAAVCSETGCQKPIQAKGLCNPHYQKQRSAENAFNGGSKNAPHYLARVRQQINEFELGRIESPTECLQRIHSILSIYENL